jgi:hypothetical protein
VVPDAQAGRPGRAWRWPAVAVVLILGVGALAAVVVRSQVPTVVAGAASPALHLGTVQPPEPSAPGTPTGGPTPTPTGTPPSPRPQPPPVPSGFKLYHGNAGYWIAIPADWWVTHEIGNDAQGDMWSTPFTQPGVRLAFIEVSAQRTTARTATAALTAYEQARSHDSDYRFYQRIRLAGRPRLAGAADVAELEFADRHEAQVIHYHTVVRAVRTPAGRLYTIHCRVEHNVIRDRGSTEDDWRFMLPAISKILNTFRLS